MGKGTSDLCRRAGCKGKVVLILDALNQLEDKQGAQELTWLPAEFPQNVWVILSTTTGKALDAVKERGYSILTLEPLALQEREEFVRKFLAQYSKQLNVQQLKRIVGNEKISNPLALQILLDEIEQIPYLLNEVLLLGKQLINLLYNQLRLLNIPYKFLHIHLLLILQPLMNKS